MVEVRASPAGAGWVCAVTVSDAGARTEHTVSVSAADVARWAHGDGAADVADLVRRSFEFPPLTGAGDLDPPPVRPVGDPGLLPRLRPGIQAMSARVEHIHIATAAGAPMQSLETVEAVAHVGLAGDRYSLKTGYWSYAEKSRDVTLIEAEEMERLAEESGIRLAPGESRRNVTTRGVRLHELVDREFWIGPVLARGLEICEPCTHLLGLVGKPVIKPLAHRAGLRAELLSSGRISVGDVIRAEA